MSRVQKQKDFLLFAADPFSGRANDRVLRMLHLRQTLARSLSKLSNSCCIVFIYKLRVTRNFTTCLTTQHKMQSPNACDDALIYLAYEDAAYCRLLLVTANHGLTLDSHEVLKVWSKCKVAAKDTKMPSEALQKEALQMNQLPP